MAWVLRRWDAQCVGDAVPHLTPAKDLAVDGVEGLVAGLRLGGGPQHVATEEPRVGQVGDAETLVRRAADIIARILGGARPGEIPVELDMRTHLFVNGPSLRELGITLPVSVRVRVDRVVE